MGDLCILVGKNNSGKSNILHALKILSDFTYHDDDIPDCLTSNNFDNKNIVPKVYIIGRNQINLRKDSNFIKNNSVIYLDQLKQNLYKSRNFLIFFLRGRRYENINNYKKINIINEIKENIKNNLLKKSITI
ncbi:ATP-binding protein [bacterium]|nr:ATP-binding protein [bacterium]